MAGSADSLRIVYRSQGRGDQRAQCKPRNSPSTCVANSAAIATRWRPVVKFGRTLCAATAVCIAACGGGGGDASPTASNPPPVGNDPPSRATTIEQRAAALALYESGPVASMLAQNVLWSLAWGGSNGRCAFDAGSVRLDIDGSLESKLLAGSHAFSASFDACVVDGLVGTSLDGTISGAYSFASEYSYGAQFSVRTLSGSHLAYVSDLGAVTGDGSLTLTSVSAGSPNTTAYTATFAPDGGFQLKNATTGNVLTFESGNYSRSHDSASGSGHDDFNGLQVAINGVSYTIDGTIHWTAGSRMTYSSGLVRITNGGVVHASIAAQQGREDLLVEVLIPLERF